jgi:hypothetical protein
MRHGASLFFPSRFFYLFFVFFFLFLSCLTESATLLHVSSAPCRCPLPQCNDGADASTATVCRPFPLFLFFLLPSFHADRVTLAPPPRAPPPPCERPLPQCDTAGTARATQQARHGHRDMGGATRPARHRAPRHGPHARRDTGSATPVARHRHRDTAGATRVARHGAPRHGPHARRDTGTATTAHTPGATGGATPTPRHGPHAWRDTGTATTAHTPGATQSICQV